MGNKASRRFLAFLISAVMLLGNFTTTFASEKDVYDVNASATLRNAEASYRKDAGEVSSASTTTNESRVGSEVLTTGYTELVSAVTGLEVPEGLVTEQNMTSLASARNSVAGNLSSEALYVSDVATMLTTAYDSNSLDRYADSDVIEVMVWLQELPAALERIYQSNDLNIAGYSNVAVDALAARNDIKTMGGTNLKNRNASPTIQIQFEYSELFAGFAITAPVSELQKIAAMPGVFAVTEMAYYELDYIPDPEYTTPGNADARQIARIGELHEMGYDGTGVKVGVIDSGIQTNHPELAANYKGGWNFNENNSNMNNQDGNHGTHVSGTIASTGSYSLGVAPNADLYMAQVFHPTLGNSGQDSVVLAAMEAFAGARPATGLPKVDVVNMSLGINDPGANSAYVSGVYGRNNLVLAGVTLVNSAGNSATFNDGNARQNYTTTSSNASLSIAVASTMYGSVDDWNYTSSLGGGSPFTITAVNNDFNFCGLYTEEDFGNKAPITVTYNASNTGGYTSNPWFDSSYYGTYTRQPLEYVEGLGYEIVYVNNSVADTTQAEVNAWKAAHGKDSMVGKILAFNRGINFSTMYSEAVRTGAGGVIMIDRTKRSDVGMVISNFPTAHCVIFQTGVEMRQILLDAKNAGTSYFMTESFEYQKQPLEVSSFSSIGPVMDNAHIKPDIAAAGDNILSTSLNNGYANMGGTSMASPFVAGCAALLVQYLRETGQNASPEVVKARLMNTADNDLIIPYTNFHAGDPRYYYDDDGTEISVYEQGSGFVNVYRAITEDVYITVENNEIYTGLNSTQMMTANMASFSFGEVSKEVGSKTMTATVHGLEDYDVEVSYNHDTRYSNKNEDLLVKVNVVKNGNTFDATVTIDPNAAADRLNGGNLYEGYITVTGNDQTYVLPWAVRLPHKSIIPPPPPGEDPNAKITLIADSSLSVYTPTLGVSMWFDATNQMYDWFMDEEGGVELSWMNEHCMRVPMGAMMGGSITSHLLVGQTASTILAPDTYDIVSVVYQNANLFGGDGEFGALKEYPFEAGYEYVFIVTSSGGNPAFNLQAMKTYNGEGPIEEGFSRITLNVPTDVWEDGSGYSMWIDKDHTILNTNYLEDIVAAADYKIPVNATLNGQGTDPVVFMGKANIIIPSGSYDFRMINISPEYGYYPPEGSYGSASYFSFEPNKSYTFTAVWENDNVGDGFVLTVVDENLDDPDPGLKPGTAPNAKITFNHGTWATPYNVNASIWFDETNYMYDNFKTPTGVTIDPDWMNANCVRLPDTAQMVVRNSMYAGGQGGSMILEPDTYDILPVWSQTQSGIDRFGTYSGDMVFEKEYEIKAGFEYIYTTSLVGGAPYLTLEIVPYNKPVDFDGNARITLDVPNDVWGDGSGYQMWFDEDGWLFDALMAGSVLFTDIEANCEYRIPENARLLSTADGPSVKAGNKVTIDIPAGYYDFWSFNPDGSQNWGVAIDQGGLSRAKNYAFEAGMHYTFTAKLMGTHDGLALTITEIGDNIVIEELNADIKAPRGNTTPQTVIDNVNLAYKGEITWTPADAKFQWETDYTASVVLTAKPGYEFGENVAVTVPGSTAVTNVVAIAGTLTFDVSYPNTGVKPPSATVIAIDESGGGFGDFYNLVALDSTCTAVEKYMGDGVNLINDFDTWIPKDFLDELTLFAGTDTNDEVPAGSYDFLWYAQDWLSSGIMDYGTVTFEAGKTYVMLLNDDYFVEIFAPGLDSFTASPAAMKKLGGTWRATAKGFFEEDFGYEVYLDGELFATGMLTGGMLTKTAGIAIPENNTGADQVYTLIVPAFEGDPNYEPKTLVVTTEEVGYAKIIFSVGAPYTDGSGYVLLLDSTNTQPQTNNFANYDYAIPEGFFEDYPGYTNTSGAVHMDTQEIIVPEGVYAIHGGNWWSGGCWNFDTRKWNDFEILPGYTYHFEKYNTGSANWIVTVIPPSVAVDTVVADNDTGKLTITFTGDLKYVPVVEEDLVVTWAGGFNPADIDQALTNFTYDQETGVATFDFTPYEQCTEDQYVVFTVLYNDEAMDSNTIVVERFTPIEDIVITYVTPSIVTVAKGKTVQLLVETEQGIDVMNNPNYVITWKSLMPTIASVNASTGLVTGKSIGMAIVQATIVDPYGNSIILNYSINVK